MSKSEMNSIFDSVFNALSEAGLAPEETDSGEIRVFLGDRSVKLTLDYEDNSIA